jgi:hypothetical protein
MHDGGAGARADERDRPGRAAEEPFDAAFLEELRLGHDVRFVLAVVGGGAVRIGRRIAARRIRYVETVAINCDPRVEDLAEFDRRVYLGGDGRAGARGSPTLGGQYAQESEPALERLFRGAHFVCVVGALGGGTGTGALPYVLEAAARASEILSVFVVKPFACEGERRALADRAAARLALTDAFYEKARVGRAWLRVLDNEELARREPTMGFSRLNERWAAVVADHIERSFVLPVEAALESFRLERLTTALPVDPPDAIHETDELGLPGPSLEPPTVLAPVDPGRMGSGAAGASDIELAFEIDGAAASKFAG